MLDDFQIFFLFYFFVLAGSRTQIFLISAFSGWPSFFIPLSCCLGLILFLELYYIWSNNTLIMVKGRAVRRVIGGLAEVFVRYVGDTECLGWPGDCLCGYVW